MDLMCKLCAVPAFEIPNLYLSFSLSNLSGGDDPCRSRGVFYRATGERRRHDRRGGRRTRASSHRLPLLWHQEATRQSTRWLSPQRSDHLYDTSSSWSAAASPSHACWWLGRDAEVQFQCWFMAVWCRFGFVFLMKLVGQGRIDGKVSRALQ